MEPFGRPMTGIPRPMTISTKCRRIAQLAKQGPTMAFTCWIVEVDLRKYFDTVDHGHLKEFLRQRVRDGTTNAQRSHEPEEPDAGILHVRICGGVQDQPMLVLSLSRSSGARSVGRLSQGPSRARFRSLNGGRARSC